MPGRPDGSIPLATRPRRLDAEEIRDAMLAAQRSIWTLCASLARRLKELKVVELRNNGPEARRLAERSPRVGTAACTCRCCAI